MLTTLGQKGLDLVMPPVTLSLLLMRVSLGLTPVWRIHTPDCRRNHSQTPQLRDNNSHSRQNKDIKTFAFLSSKFGVSRLSRYCKKAF